MISKRVFSVFVRFCFSSKEFVRRQLHEKVRTNNLNIQKKQQYSWKCPSASVRLMFAGWLVGHYNTIRPSVVFTIS